MLYTTRLILVLTVLTSCTGHRGGIAAGVAMGYSTTCTGANVQFSASAIYSVLISVSRSTTVRTTHAVPYTPTITAFPTSEQAVTHDPYKNCPINHYNGLFLMWPNRIRQSSLLPRYWRTQPRKTSKKWIENIKEDFQLRNIQFKDAVASCKDRTAWRQLISSTSSSSWWRTRTEEEEEEESPKQQTWLQRRGTVKR